MLHSGMLIPSAVFALAQLVTPGCVQPFAALDIAHALERERVGSAYRPFDTGVGESKGARSASARIVVVTFGCRGDYQAELAQEDAEVGEGRTRFVRYQNDAAMAIVVFLRPPTAREGVIARATLEELTP